MRNRLVDWLAAGGFLIFSFLWVPAMLVAIRTARCTPGEGASTPATAEQPPPSDTEAAKAATPEGATSPAPSEPPASKEQPAPEPPVWDRPRFEERKAERLAMVRDQMERRGVKDKAVLDAMGEVPRHLFVSDEFLREAYADHPLPIGHGQTISQPYIVAYMTGLLELKPGGRALEIGTGSGYQAAVLSELTPHVFSIEIIRPLAEQAAERLRKLGYATVQTKQEDGYYGWKEHAPFDAIIVTAAAGHVPPPLVEQLKPGGKMVIPIGDVFETQHLVVVGKDKDGRVSARSVLPVRFVPMTGQAQQEP